MNKFQFKNLVLEKIKVASLKYLIDKIKSKGREIDYGNILTCQSYLRPNSILTFEEQLLIFSYRVRMNPLQYNFKGNNCIELCICGTEINNEHLYICESFTTNRTNKLPYSKIFNGTISEQQIIIQILTENMKIFSQAQDSQPSSH